MSVKFGDLQLAFDFVSSGGLGENRAILDIQTGRLYWHSEIGDNFEEDQEYQEKPDDRAWYWYTDLANYNSALYYHWSTRDVYETLKRPEFQFCDGSEFRENSLDYWFFPREKDSSQPSAVTAIFSPQ